ncbi:MAG: hypothetical protein IPK32_23300 [Verrucomicrobiaceae bacterium]|nr:hypothetical protein [Verrucomicrobiaceae bacterium]
MQRVPEAELQAATMLVKMKRYEDASILFSRLIESYPGSQIAERATKEKASIAGMKNGRSRNPPRKKAMPKRAKSLLKAQNLPLNKAPPDAAKPAAAPPQPQMPRNPAPKRKNSSTFSNQYPMMHLHPANTMTSPHRHSLVRYLPLLALTAMTGLASAQEAAGQPPLRHIQKETPHHALRPGWLGRIPLLICSIVMVWLTVDLWGRTGAKKVAPPAQVAQMQDLFRGGDYVGAYQFAKSNASPFSDVSRVCLSFAGDGHDAVDAAMFSEINKVNATIQTRINYLSVIGVCTPHDRSDRRWLV